MRSRTTYTIPLIVFLLLAAPEAFAQNETSLRKLYAHLGGGAATHQGYSSSTGLQAVWKGGWTTAFSYHNTSMNPRNLPRDYDPGTVFLISDGYPESNVSMCSLSAGRYFAAGKKVWFTTEAGLSYAQGEKFTFQRQSTANGNWLFKPANYSTATQKASSAGVLLKADMTWAFASFAGLGSSVYANINSVQSPVGIEIKLIAGWMNREK